MAAPEASGKAQQWARQARMAHKGIRRHVIREGTTSTRFRVRAEAHTLPTYANEKKKTATGTKHAIYGDLLEDGQCRCCKEAKPETLQHITECSEDAADIEGKTRLEIKASAEQKIKQIWEDTKVPTAWGGEVNAPRPRR